LVFVTVILYFLDKGYKKTALNTMMVCPKYTGFAQPYAAIFFHLHACFNGDGTAQIHCSFICELQFMGIFNK